MPRLIYVIATMDTKGREAQFVADAISKAGGTAVTVDVSTQGQPTVRPEITREVVADCHPRGRGAVLGKGDRGAAMTVMSEALTEFLRQRHAGKEVDGVIGLGGTGGTALLAPAFRALPLGVPKVSFRRWPVATPPPTWAAPTSCSCRRWWMWPGSTRCRGRSSRMPHTPSPGW